LGRGFEREALEVFSFSRSLPAGRNGAAMASPLSLWLLYLALNCKPYTYMSYEEEDTCHMRRRIHALNCKPYTSNHKH
jgi:hypothetical protein